MSDTKKTADKPKAADDRTFLLAPYGGDRPPRPAWFEGYLGHEPELGELDVQGAKIVWQRWGDSAKKPGVILVHGGVAHMNWWDFIGPALSQRRSVTALSLSGMGDSGWREGYHLGAYADEVMAVAEASGLMEGGRKPIIIGHSFGGFVTMETARRFGDQIAGAVILDAPIRPPEEQRRSAPPRRGGRVYDSLPEALGRFRLLPDQDCVNPFLVDHIARHSLKITRREDGGRGWTWKFDPNLWAKMNYPEHAAADFMKTVECPVAAIRGEISALVTGEVWRYMARVLPEGAPMISVPEARHHLMLDQPLALISSLRTLLSTWPAKAD